MKEDVFEIVKDRYGESTIHDENVVEMTLTEVLNKLEEVKLQTSTWGEKCVIQKIIDELK